MSQKFFIFVVWTDPEPNHRPTMQHTNRAPIEVNANRVNWEVVVNLLETQRRVSGIHSPKSVCSLCFRLNRGRCGKKELTKLLCGFGLHRA